MPNGDIYVFGMGQTAEAVHALIADEELFRIRAFCVDAAFARTESFLGCPVIAIENADPAVPVFVAIGFSDLNHSRASVYQRLKKEGRKFASVVSRHAIVRASCKIGENCLIMEQNNLQASVSVGDNSFLWSGNHLGHHSTIGSHCYVSSHCVISGAVSIGDHTFIGVNSAIGDNIKVGMGCIIGQGATVDGDLPDYTVVRAPPARTDTRSAAFNRRLLRR